MKKFLFLLACGFSPVLLLSQEVIPTATQNYVHKTVYKNGVQESGLGSVPTNDKIETVSYFDGLGRPLQTIGVRQGGKDALNNDTDLITLEVYDSYGRKAKNYLPYANNQNNGRYESDAIVKVNSYYTNNFGVDIDAASPNPFSETLFEPSSLNRVQKQAAPGKAWKMGSGREIKFDYQTNAAGEVRMYKVSLTSAYVPTLQNPSGASYAAGQLFKNITKDENWISGLNNTTEEFTDKQGRVVLKRTYNANLPHDTYYVYDDYGNLTYVLPPKAEPHAGMPDAVKLAELCYQYRYDKRNRLIEKKIPGKGTATNWESIVYNNLDQPIMTQDPNLRAQNKWMFIKYNAFGRVAFTGFTNINATRTTLQTAADGWNSDNWVKKAPANTLGGTTVYYDNGGYPSTVSEVLTINYYDDYNFNNDGVIVPGNTLYHPTITTVKGLPTGSKVKVLGTTSWITTVTGYDQHRRPIWSGSKNAYLGTVDYVESKIDNTIGWVAETRTRHIKGTTITTIDKFTYDHSGKLLTHTNKINSLPEESIAVNKYDPLGQLIQKKVGNTSIKELQVVDYNYNIRGWLKGINDVANLGTVDLFAFRINYNTVNHTGTPLFNGNIAETSWKTKNDNVLRWYRYGYDALNRLTSATAYSSNYNVSGVYYDKNGNITNLTRRGAINEAATSFGNMDILTYGYESYSNKLKTVNDSGNTTYGFKNGSTALTQYTYDINGNMTRDFNKGILGPNSTEGITYNHLNLPAQVTIGTGNIQYIYDATGVKQRKIVSSGTTTDYAGNYLYQEGTLQFFNHPEGYVENNAGIYKYHYQYKDHLGNVRLTYADLDGNGSINASTEIISEKNYYPFGLLHKGYNSVVTSNSNSVAEKFKYNGKELQEDLGLNTYDYGARMYDPELGRFMQLDPHADSYPWATPYNYAFNNPALVIDPDGKDGIVSGSGTKKDPYVVTANYYHYGLSDGQAKGLQSAADAYNNKGKAHTITDADGNKLFVKFDIGITKADNAEQANKLASLDYKDTSDGGVARYGNVVGIGSSSEGNEFGSASRFNIELNQEKITNTLNANPGGSESSVIRGVFIHEIGHNIGGNHGDPGSIMQNTGIIPNRSSNTIGGSGNGTFNYDNPSVDKNGLRAIMGRVNMVPGTINSAYLSDKENKRVQSAEKDGTVGRLKTIN